MVPLRFVFRSRWWALAWAVGILWTAVDYAGDRAADPTINGQDNGAQLDPLAAALG